VRLEDGARVGHIRAAITEQRTPLQRAAATVSRALTDEVRCEMDIGTSENLLEGGTSDPREALHAAFSELGIARVVRGARALVVS
jgi:hypothetical protein